ncbi:hypothetical protein WN943_007422 [Citrus x changshan-huyou]
MHPGKDLNLLASGSTHPAAYSQVVSLLQKVVLKPDHLFKQGRVLQSVHWVMNIILIGNALMVHLNHAVDGCVARIAAKLEMMEPCSSVKERIAFSMIKEAEHRGLLSPGKCVLIEITGGNTGIRLAFIAAVFIAIPSVANIDKELCLELWEQKFFLFEQAGVFEEILKVAEEMVKKTPNGFLLQQFNNPANPKIHYNYTGPVIWEDSGGKVDAFNRDWRYCDWRSKIP